MTSKGDTVTTPKLHSIRHRWHSSRFKFVGGLCVLFVLLSGQLGPPTSRFRRLCHQQPEIFSYPGERIKWTPCGSVKDLPLECSSLTVPMDQFNKSVSSDKHFTVPLIRLRGENATQNILLNPGGPGASGFGLIRGLGDALRTISGKRFHLVAFDPRGVIGSVPAASCYPDEDVRSRLAFSRYARILEDSTVVYARSKNLVQACIDTMGEYGKYINTPQTAADMNSILDALGQQDMLYWGFSYGTLLGQTYATLFPDRSHRIIIDGVVNQFEWYESLFETESLLDAEKVFEGFFIECVKANKHCPLTRISSSSQELKHRTLSFANSLRDQPLDVYINTTVHGLLTYEIFMYNAIFPALYAPETWPQLALHLTSLFEGNATGIFLKYGLDEWTPLSLDARRFIRLNDGLSGSEYWPQERQALLDKLLPFMNETLFGERQNTDYYSKQAWLLPRSHTYKPKTAVKTKHPLLVLSNSYDPVCPLVSAKAAKHSFEGAKLLELKAYGHCATGLPSLCIAKHVKEYLANGTLPTGNVTCDIDGPYYFKLDDTRGDTNVQSGRVFDSKEDESIHRAQIEMARYWPPF